MSDQIVAPAPATTFDWDEGLGAALGRALRRSGPVSFLDGDTDASERCPFVQADACAVAWHGGVNPCPPLLRTYACFVRGREKLMTRWEVGCLLGERLAAIWVKPAYAAFRERVRRFDFPPCTDCGCDLAAGNEEDCFGNPHPVCGELPLGARHRARRLRPAGPRSRGRAGRVSGSGPSRARALPWR